MNLRAVGLATLAIALTLSACLPIGCRPEPVDEGTPAGGSQPSTEEAFKVACVFPGPVNDGGWNQAGYTGLQAIASELGAEIAYTQSVAPDGAAGAFQVYGGQGYDLVIGHSDQYQDAVATVSAGYPETYFVTIGGSKSTDNYSSVVIATEQAGYLMGIVAGSMSKTGKFGCVGSAKGDAVDRPFKSCLFGGRTINPGLEIDVAYTGSTDDAAKGYEIAKALIGSGADLIVENAGASGAGAIQAAKELGVYCFSVSADRSSEAPERVVASVVVDYGACFVSFARAVKDGAAGEPGAWVYGLKEGAVRLVWNETVKGQLSADLLAIVQKAREDIEAGVLVPLK